MTISNRQKSGRSSSSKHWIAFTFVHVLKCHNSTRLRIDFGRGWSWQVQKLSCDKTSHESWFNALTISHWRLDKNHFVAHENKKFFLLIVISVVDEIHQHREQSLIHLKSLWQCSTLVHHECQRWWEEEALEGNEFQGEVQTRQKKHYCWADARVLYHAKRASWISDTESQLGEGLSCESWIWRCRVWCAFAATNCKLHRRRENGSDFGRWDARLENCLAESDAVSFDSFLGQLERPTWQEKVKFIFKVI